MAEAHRPTPYELVLAGEPFESRHFPEIRAELVASAEPVREAAAFLRLGRVGELLQELVPPDAPGVAIREYAALLYHGYRHWEHGRFVVRVERDLARDLVENPAAVGDWTLRAPRPAGYVQLPRHLFWARVAENATPEAVDGFFWVLEAGGAEPAADLGGTEPVVDPKQTESAADPGRATSAADPGRETRASGPSGEPAAAGPARLDLLLVLGIMPNRAGFSVIEVGAPLPAEVPRHWADAEARPGARDFENVLPGGEMEGLFALVTELEALKLASRVFARIREKGEDGSAGG